MQSYYRIIHSLVAPHTGKRKHYHVSLIGANAEMLSSSEVVVTLANARKNIVAQIKANNGNNVLVKEVEGKKTLITYNMFQNGRKKFPPAKKSKS